MTLSEFILARQDDREKHARSRFRRRKDAPPHSLTGGDCCGNQVEVEVPGDRRTMSMDEYQAEFCEPVEPDPWVMADIASKRKIVDLHRPEGSYVYRDDGTPACGTCGDYTVPWPCVTLRLLALPDSGHGDYDPSWRP